MANLITAPFTGGGAFPVDERMEKSKAEMLTTNDNVMPENYLCLCKDDGQIYIYNKNNTFDEQTGKYRLFESGGGTDDYEQLINKPKFNGVTVEGSKESQDYNMTLSVQEIEKILYLD